MKSKKKNKGNRFVYNDADVQSKKKKKKENVEKAINLSMDKYCSVTHMLNSTATITHSFEIKN